MRSRRLALAAVVALALALRLVRAASRWDEIALAYAAYQQPWLDQAAEGSISGMLGTFVGLHPPLYSALFGLLELVWGAPMGWLLLSAVLSTLAVWLVGRVGGWIPALVLACDPLQLAYAAEVNNYPLLVFAAALCLHEAQAVLRGGPWWRLALAGAVAGWSHVLGGLFGGLLILGLLGRQREDGLRALGLMAVLALPVFARALELSGAEGTTSQAGLDLGLIFTGLQAKAPWWVLVWLAGGLSWMRWRSAALSWSVAACILAMMGLGVAASHQQPYWLLLGPPVALALPRVAGLGAGLYGLVLASSLTLQPASELRQARHHPRGLDTALAASQPGDAIWLLAPALMPDDDKTMDSDVLWRFAPWRRMPPWRGAFEFTDYKFGQPRVMDGRIVHTTTSLQPAVVDAVLRWHTEAGRSAFFVLYDHSPARDYTGMLERTLQPWSPRCVEVGEDRGLGADVYCQVGP